jgi:hypothetical protein
VIVHQQSETIKVETDNAGIFNDALCKRIQQVNKDGFRVVTISTSIGMVGSTIRYMVGTLLIEKFKPENS